MKKERKSEFIKSKILYTFGPFEVEPFFANVIKIDNYNSIPTMNNTFYRLQVFDVY